MASSLQSVTTNATITRFHPVRGGFATSPSYKRDLFIPPAVAKVAGIGTLRSGERIEAEALDTPRGPQITRILRREELRFHDAVMKTYSPTTSYGFAVLSTGGDVFVHRSIFKDHGINAADLLSGTPVQVAYVSSDRGLRALAIRLP